MEQTNDILYGKVINRVPCVTKKGSKYYLPLLQSINLAKLQVLFPFYKDPILNAMFIMSNAIYGKTVNE